MDAMRGCLNKNILLMICFGLKGCVELHQYYSWYIFDQWMRRKLFLGTLCLQNKSFVQIFRNLNQSLFVIFEMKLFLKFGTWVYQLFCMSHFKLKCSEPLLQFIGCNANVMLRSYQSQACAGLELLTWMGNSN